MNTICLSSRLVIVLKLETKIRFRCEVLARAGINAGHTKMVTHTQDGHAYTRWARIYRQHVATSGMHTPHDTNPHCWDTQSQVAEHYKQRPSVARLPMTTVLVSLPNCLAASWTACSGSLLTLRVTCALAASCTPMRPVPSGASAGFTGISKLSPFLSIVNVMTSFGCILQPHSGTLPTHKQQMLNDTWQMRTEASTTG